MIKRFAQKIEDMRRLIGDSRSASSTTFLLAVSGGMDSMCMADLFLKQFGAGAIAIAHCNFHLRDLESDGDENLVCEWARNNGVKVFVKHFDTISYAKERGLSIEMAARDLRYAWFSHLCQDNGYSALVVAHNANDNAETLMLNLLRGTGLKGLHCMDSISRLSVNEGQEMIVLRPLLEFTRKQIEGHVLTHKVPYRDDSTNFESEYKRNRIRNEVFPVFERINPSYIRTLNREIGYFSEAGSIVDEWCQSQVPSVLLSADPAVISISALLSIPHWRYLLYYLLEPYGFNSQITASVEDLLSSSRTLSGKRFESDSYVLYTERDTLVLRKRDIEAGHVDVFPDIDADVCAVVRGPGIYNHNGVRWQVELIDRGDGIVLIQPDGTLVADADKLVFPFVCRKWKQGDWFVPFGMRGKKKVSDLFGDLKMTSIEKSMALMVVDCRGNLAEQQHVAAVLGRRLDDRYRVDDTTKKIVRITLLNNTENL